MVWNSIFANLHFQAKIYKHFRITFDFKTNSFIGLFILITLYFAMIIKTLKPG